ncbi:sensor histidine kinase [Cystobacter fuscus]
MLGWVQVLRNGNLPPEKRERALETVERNARAQGQLIEDLLDVSRIMSGKLKLDVGPVEVGHVVEQALESVRPAADAKGLRLQTALDSTGHVMGDARRLQQVVWNLLSNAVKFTPKGGRVQVFVERRDSAVEITVADTGPGIAPEFLPHVFERFRRAEGPLTRRAGGLGLGLSIVKQLVEMHGGTVAAFSAGVDQGSTFTVRLPLSVAMRREATLPPRCDAPTRAFPARRSSRACACSSWMTSTTRASCCAPCWRNATPR